MGQIDIERHVGIRSKDYLVRVRMVKRSVLSLLKYALQVRCHYLDHFLVLRDKTEVLFVQFVHYLPQADSLFQLEEKIVETCGTIGDGHVVQQVLHDYLEELTH